MPPAYDVIVAGAGPVGLFLAGELALAGTTVLVLEQRAEDNPLWAAPLGLRGINTLTLESLTRRGLLGKFFPGDDALKAIATRWKPGPLPQLHPFKKTGAPMHGGHFAGIFFDANKLDLDRWPYRVNAPGLVPGMTTMAHTVHVFRERAEALGVTVLRGMAVAGIVSGTEDDSDGVVVQVRSVVDSDDSKTSANETFPARYLVGCDGGHSTVRKAGGFPAIGSTPKFTGYAMRCELAHGEGLQRGFVVTDHGMYIALPFGDAFYLIEPDGGAYYRQQTPTRAHMQGVLARVTGNAEVRIASMGQVTSFTDRCLHAGHYRAGRVLLAGDAAHTHASFGAQGLNLGVGDAMNLGWKLAAMVRQEALQKGRAGAGVSLSALDTALLDTYGAERIPVAKQVLELSLAQSMSIYPDAYGKAVRAMFQRAIDTADGANLFMGLFWGLSLKYDLGAGLHPLVGLSAPDFALDDAGDDDSEKADDDSDRPRLSHRLFGGRGLLVDLTSGGGSTALKSLVGAGSAYAGRVDYLAAPGVADKRGLQAFLVRPDGAVAWAVDDGTELVLGDVEAALQTWFGF